MPDAAFVTCRHCPWTGEATTFTEVMALLDAHQCNRFVEGIEHGNETGYCFHRCRCPACRQAHTVAESQRKDGHRPGHRRGETHPWAKLRAADVIDIRRLLADGVSSTEVARRYRVTQSNIHKIAIGDTWRSVSQLSDA